VTSANAGPYAPRPSPSPPPPEPSLSPENYTFPPGFSSVPYFIYPYLTSSPTASATASPTSTSTSSPFPYSPAGGGPGGNPSLYDTLYSVSVVVTNTGNRPGKEVVQLYLSFPDSIGEPPRQLRGFEKISLQPGESTTVNFDLLRKEMSYWDAISQNWVVGNGTYIIYAGRSSRDLILQQTIDVS